jgi:hypothetical protein
MNLGEPYRQGRFISDGTAVNLSLRSDVDHMIVTNYTNWGSTANPGEVIRSEWYRGMPAGEALQLTKANSDNTTTNSVASSGGFTLLDTTVQAAEAEKDMSGAFMTDAAPPVVTVTSHGYTTGDIVRVYNTTTALQVAGIEAEISVTNSNTFTLRYMIAPGAAATAGNVRRISNQALYKPRNRFIATVSKASSAVVIMTVSHGYQVGEKVRFKVPPEFGMVELDGLVGEITAINTSTNAITVDIDSSAFTTWTWPVNGDVPFTFAQVIPEGEVPTIISGANFNDGIIGMHLGLNVVGASADVLHWQAFKSFGYSTTV